MTDCLFCRIAAGEVPSKVVLEDEHVYAFHDIDPRAPNHVLVIPRQHVASVAAVSGDEAGTLVLGRVLQAARMAAAKVGLTEEGGYRLVINCGEAAGQSVMHLHVHVLGGRAFGWPPG